MAGQTVLLSYLQVLNQIVLVKDTSLQNQNVKVHLILSHFLTVEIFKSIIVNTMRNKIMYKFQLNSNKEFKSSENYNIIELFIK